MKHLARVLAVAGFALAVTLFAREDVGSIVRLVVAAGPGLLLAALFHVLPMLANARAWGRLLPTPRRPSLRILASATWIRESINGLLPVARIGGEVVAYRLLRRHGVRRSEAAASLVADMALSVLSQAAFAIAGVALLVTRGQASTVTTRLLAGVAAMILLGAGFVLAQRAGALGGATRVLDRLFAGRLGLLHTRSLRFEQALRAVYARHRDVAGCFAWQLVGWALGAGEIYIALYALGQPRSVLDAVVIEALIQAVASAAFIVPVALGVQEGAFVVIGAALGLDATTALALATARRLRDVVIFFPGLIAWQRAEARGRDADPAAEAGSR
jgi:putative membrane protein